MMQRSAHFGDVFSVADAQKLNLDFAMLTAPWHMRVLYDGQSGGVENIGIPIRFQLSDLRRVVTQEQIANVLKMRNRSRRWVIGNEWNLAWDLQTPAQTPSEFVDFVSRNMAVIVPQTFGLWREQIYSFSLSDESAMRGNPSPARLALRELKKRPNVARYFSGAATNFYPMTRGAHSVVEFIREVLALLDEEGFPTWTLSLKEIGFDKTKVSQAQAAEFIEKLFAALERNADELKRLESIVWYAATDLTAYQMPYVPLLDNFGVSAAGKAWAQA